MALFERRPEKYLQFYAQVHFLTCEECLSHHGEIAENPKHKPPLHPDCRCHLLEFSPKDLEYYQEQAERMKLRAQQELLRRRLWCQARDSLEGDFSQAKELFRQAAHIEFYLEEVEQLCAEKRELFENTPELRAQLQKLFIKCYRMKFSLDKYRPIPPKLILLWETEGIRRIKELLP